MLGNRNEYRKTSRADCINVYNRTDQGQGAQALHTYSWIIISHCDLL